MRTSSRPSDIHPSILDVVNRVTTGIMNGKLTDQKSIAAATMYSSIRIFEYSKLLITIIVGHIIVLALSIVGWIKMSPATGLGVMLTGIVPWSVFSFRHYNKYHNRLTWKEMQSLIPALHLPPEQNQYLVCLQIIDESTILNGDQKRAYSTKLHHAIDQIVELTESGADEDLAKLTAKKQTVAEILEALSTKTDFSRIEKLS